MDKIELKRRILKRFKKRLTGRILITIGKKKLKIEYMFGGKYSLKKYNKGNETLLEMLGNIDKIVDLIYKEKFKIY